MSEKTCWLVDEENGIATDGKRYWCAMKHWKCAKDMVPVSELRSFIEDSYQTAMQDSRGAEESAYNKALDDVLKRFCEPKEPL